MGVTALWTAAKYRHAGAVRDRQQPVLFQRRAAPGKRRRSGAVATRPMPGSASGWTIPPPTSPAMARAQGVEADRPGDRPQDDLTRAIAEGVAALRDGRPFLIDVWIDPRQGRETAVKRNTRAGSDRNTQPHDAARRVTPQFAQYPCDHGLDPLSARGQASEVAVALELAHDQPAVELDVEGDLEHQIDEKRRQTATIADSSRVSLARDTTSG